jgi:hypothetical protein
LNIVIITGQHLISNPRVWKEANALDAAGYNVSIFTLWYSQKKLNQDFKLINPGIKYNASINLIPTYSNLLFIFITKSIKRIAQIIFKYLRIATIYQELYLPCFQVKNIICAQGNIYICHQEQGLFLGNILIKKGYKVAFDFEDLYSEDYLNKYRPVDLLKNAELFALTNASYVTCPSVSMLNVLKKTCGYRISIQVIYNSFPFNYLKKSGVEKIPNSFVWFSQTIGPGRGIEEFVKALKIVDLNLNIFLIGNISKNYQEYLVKELDETRHSVSFMPTMSHTSLIEYLLKFQVGLALELPQSLSRDLTITNKLLLYLQLGLRTIASKTTGQLELKDYFHEQITYVDIKDSISFARRIEEEILELPPTTIYPFNKKFCWDSSKDVLIELVQKALQG